ncbi:ABC transporter ATP-binding protein [Kitasatospora sp. NPDC088134]|uniref:ABC transporter ATP-binding protein n=1 Tax=Kitasatospora sp. NPDC088134 TaxID=3364071 RepID=UPI003818461D
MMNSMAGPDTGPAIRIAGLVVERGGRPVLPGLDLDVPRGSVTGLLGPSGCGKTTLLRSVVGVQRTTAGTVTVLGRPAGSAALRDRVGYVTQAPSVYGDLTVGENLDHFAAVLGAPAGDPARVTALVGLDEHRRTPVARLSGGQRARVSLAAALLGRPELLVLDEPTVGLDPVLRQELWQLFRRLAEEGATLLISSHVMDEATRCDRLLLMRDGRLLAHDTPAALLAATGAADIEAAFLDLVRSVPAPHPGGTA